MDPVSRVRQHDQTLQPSGDEVIWTVVGLPFGLTAFESKAYYAIGLVREMVATAGLARLHGLQLGAIFQSLDAIELIGRAVGGYRQSPGEAGKRLRTGLEFALDLNEKAAAPLRVHSVQEYLDLRNFLGHGAASSATNISFGRSTALALMHLVTRAVDAMWTDPAAMAKFAACQIDPLFTSVNGQPEAIYVRDVQAHLLQGNAPSSDTRFGDWRDEPIG